MAIQNCVQAARPDYVFHLAAQSYPQTSFTAPLDTLDTNIQGTERLLGALRRFSPEAIIRRPSTASARSMKHRALRFTPIA